MKRKHAGVESWEEVSGDWDKGYAQTTIIGDELYILRNEFIKYVYYDSSKLKKRLTAIIGEGRVLQPELYMKHYAGSTVYDLDWVWKLSKYITFNKQQDIVRIERIIALLEYVYEKMGIKGYYENITWSEESLRGHARLTKRLKKMLKELRKLRKIKSKLIKKEISK